MRLFTLYPKKLAAKSTNRFPRSHTPCKAKRKFRRSQRKIYTRQYNTNTYFYIYRSLCSKYGKLCHIIYLIIVKKQTLKEKIIIKMC
jgi:hypothetical protein